MNQMNKDKIKIVVKGGMVQVVYSNINRKNIEVELIDMDADEEDFEPPPYPEEGDENQIEPTREEYVERLDFNLNRIYEN